MKKIFFALSLLVPFLISSCSKDNEKSTPYPKTITGVNFTTVDAIPAGSIGVDDSKASMDSFRMDIYPTPCTNLMSVNVIINNAIPLTLTAKLVNVTYPGAPTTMTWPGIGTVPVTIQNANVAGIVASSLTKDIDKATTDTSTSGIHGIGGGQNVQFSFDASALPQGFYRVYIESSDGRSLWDNGWILRP